MRHRIFYRVRRVLAHLRHAGRTKFLKPRQERGSGSRKRRGHG